NGQLEVDVPGAISAETTPENAPPPEAQRPLEVAGERGRSRRGGRGRGRGGRDRERPAEAPGPITTPVSVPMQANRDNGGPGSAGERLTRDEAFDLLRRAVASLASDDHSVRASIVRHRARELLGRDSESLSERNFIRILKDAHDADVLNLRRRGDDFEVARAEAALPISEQLAKAEPEPTPSGTATAPRLSIRGRVSGSRGRTPTSLPPELLSLGVVTPVIPTAVVSAVPSVGDELGEEAGQVDA